ncbi:hypothetical protein [Streptomyces sp. ICBB 8177]|uniref:hypothetical protein n=1 Tax=Streptomyces sp. ICBB 8177 TaxID=563922 RepID=UPI000D674622|nr:hypothetical protein [Streptomyces sp. ICBB 8177]PWI43296.1 hypothetical protein CK485_14150 [Streptomyces sp. ICBB 8177]
MSETVRTQGPAITALAGLLAAFPDLPAASFEITTLVTADAVGPGVRVALHDDLGAFETWRAALGIDPGAVGHTELITCRCLKAQTQFAGVPLVLVGFAPLTAPVRGAA